MGTFHYPAEIGDPTGTRFERVDALVDTGAMFSVFPASQLRRLVDTGAMFSVFPASQLRRLGVTPHDRARLLIGDGRRIEVDLGQTSLRVDGKSVITTVVFGDEELGPVLGAYALEGLLLAVDPVNRRLIPIEGLWPSLMDPRQFG